MFAEGETCSAGRDKRPIWSALGVCLVNHNAPSGPVVMPVGPLPAFGTGNSVTAPAVVMRPILLAKESGNQSAPSGPVVMLWVPPSSVGTGSSVKAKTEALR